MRESRRTERSCGKAGFVARNNLDGDGGSWFNIFSPTSGVEMARCQEGAGRGS